MLLRLFASVVNTIRENNKRNKTMHELYRLSDRELRDIGITRSDIDQIASNSIEINKNRREYSSSFFAQTKEA